VIALAKTGRDVNKKMAVKIDHAIRGILSNEILL